MTSKISKFGKLMTVASVGAISTFLPGVASAGTVVDIFDTYDYNQTVSASGGGFTQSETNGIWDDSYWLSNPDYPYTGVLDGRRKVQTSNYYGTGTDAISSGGTYYNQNDADSAGLTTLTYGGFKVDGERVAWDVTHSGYNAFVLEGFQADLLGRVYLTVRDVDGGSDTVTKFIDQSQWSADYGGILGSNWASDLFFEFSDFVGVDLNNVYRMELKFSSSPRVCPTPLDWDAQMDTFRLGTVSAVGEETAVTSCDFAGGGGGTGGGGGGGGTGGGGGGGGTSDVPIPAGLILLGTGLASLTLRRRKRA